MPEPYDWLAKLAREDYKRYLATSHWRNLRSAALARYRRCAQCGFDPDGMTGLLEVHHLTYERVGCERPDDLEVLPARLWISPKPGYAEGVRTFLPAIASVIVLTVLLARPRTGGAAVPDAPAWIEVAEAFAPSGSGFSQTGRSAQRFLSAATWKSGVWLKPDPGTPVRPAAARGHFELTS
jgi:hypothetical protein